MVVITYEATDQTTIYPKRRLTTPPRQLNRGSDTMGPRTVALTTTAIQNSTSRAVNPSSHPQSNCAARVTNSPHQPALPASVHVRATTIPSRLTPRRSILHLYAHRTCWCDSCRKSLSEDTLSYWPASASSVLRPRSITRRSQIRTPSIASVLQESAPA